MNLIDSYLNKTTMYHLMELFLEVLIGVAVVLSFFHILPFNPIMLLVSALFLYIVCWGTNYLFSQVFEATTNNESATITALILALIINPPKTAHDFVFLFWAAVLSMASKYILAIGKKHIFNPAAIAVALTAFGINAAATWWVGNLVMTPFVVGGGLLVARKIQREDMMYGFFITTLLTVVLASIFKQINLVTTLDALLLHSSLFFFMFVMLTEPLTTPPTKRLQIFYAILVGILFSPYVHIGKIYLAPELALVIGNIYSYLVSPKAKLMLKLKEKIKLSVDTYDFVFASQNNLSFIPGQYMEWTLPHTHQDLRGNRRYFTLASSPTENSVRIGVKFYEQASSFKKAMFAMDQKTSIVASQIAGDFTLPKDTNKKIVFIAGGIGVTPYRSIIKYLLDKNERRDVVLLYSNKFVSEIVYKDIFDQAEKQLGLHTIYTLTDKEYLPLNWQGEVGRINENMIKQRIPDYQERLFYLSGPHDMVKAFEQTLRQMGVKANHIKIDFFPGFV